MFSEIEKLKQQLESLINPDEPISQADFKDWVHHPITQILLAEIKLYILDNGMPMVHMEPADETTRTQQTLMRGEHTGFLWLLNWVPEALEEKDDE